MVQNFPDLPVIPEIDIKFVIEKKNKIKKITVNLNI